MKNNSFLIATNNLAYFILSHILCPLTFTKRTAAIAAICIKAKNSIRNAIITKPLLRISQPNPSRYKYGKV